MASLGDKSALQRETVALLAIVQLVAVSHFRKMASYMGKEGKMASFQNMTHAAQQETVMQGVVCMAAVFHPQLVSGSNCIQCSTKSNSSYISF